MDKERYQPAPTRRIPSTPAEVDQTRNALKTAVAGNGKEADFKAAIDAVTRLDLMGEATKPEVLFRLRQLGNLPGWKTDIDDAINAARIARDPDEIQRLVRIAHLFGKTEDSFGFNTILRIFDKNIPSSNTRYQELWNEAEQERAAQAAAAQAQAQAAAQARANAQAAAAASAPPPPPPPQPPNTGPAAGNRPSGTGTTPGGTGRRPSGTTAGTGPRSSGPTSKPTGPAAGPANPASAPSTGPAIPNKAPAWEVLDAGMIKNLDAGITIAQRTEDPDTHRPIDPVKREDFIKNAEAKKQAFEDGKTHFIAEWAKVESTLNLPTGRDQIDVLERYTVAFQILRDFATSKHRDKNMNIAAAIVVLFPKIWPIERVRRGWMGATAGSGSYADEVIGLHTYLPSTYHSYTFNPAILDPSYTGPDLKLKISQAEMRKIGPFKTLLTNRLHPDLYQDDQATALTMRVLYDRFNHYWDAVKQYIDEMP